MNYAIANPVRINEAYEIQLATCCRVDPITNGALNAFEEALGSLLVQLMQILHVP